MRQGQFCSWGLAADTARYHHFLFGVLLYKAVLVLRRDWHSDVDVSLGLSRTEMNLINRKHYFEGLPFSPTESTYYFLLKMMNSIFNL